MIKSLINKHLRSISKNSPYAVYIYAYYFCIVRQSFSCFSLLLVNSTLYGKRQIITPCKVYQIALANSLYELQAVNGHTDIETSFFGLSHDAYITILYAGCFLIHKKDCPNYGFII